MIELAEKILAAFEDGKMTRRQAARRLAFLSLGGLLAGRAGGEEAAPPLFAADGLNHLALDVTDVARSRDFYERTCGLKVIADRSPNVCFLAAGEHYVGLFRSTTPGVDHFCFNIPVYDAGAVEAKLAGAKLAPFREENRVYFRDPDGITVQLSGKWDTWPGPRPDRR
jgi:catechol 2,3-dioxygenase-like lactoylglutathione lyase family enzyme